MDDPRGLPFDIKEAMSGVETHIETIDVDRDNIVDMHDWVRTYAENQRALPP
ncbi:hypothetical protein ACTMUQ_13670 [Streptomyces sp. SD11]|uniref:hypothetical protein n=1 Tax=Streptomyces sp. SD11 TaxID=3452209 RepID=UPI003F893C6E